ncbi:MAG: RlmE family RNA methyltransferase [Gammaproteobacteria bacterium]|nr:RlmE family RNA methyltransferase [Gammaproteobacteria bacterium]
MNRRAKTRQWAERQAKDPWVRKARSRGLAARSAFKLEEIIRRHRLIRPGDRVLELGAAPGGWTRLAREAAGREGRVVAVDRLPMRAPEGVNFLQGDLTDESVRNEALVLLGGAAAVVLCDLAPNLTGVAETDSVNKAELGDLAAQMAAFALKPGGALLVKTFSGESGDGLRQRLRGEYRQVKALKPAASRAGSSEFYLLAMGFKPRPEATAGPENAI